MMFSKSKSEKTASTMGTGSRTTRTVGGGSPSIIGADVHIQGNLTTAGELQIDGQVEGDIKCGSLTMGENGSVSGSIDADSAVIKGRIEGKVQAKQVRLEKSAHVDGDIFHETLSVEAGAQLTGKVIYASREPEAPAKLTASSDTSKKVSSTGGSNKALLDSPTADTGKSSQAAAS